MSEHENKKGCMKKKICLLLVFLLGILVCCTWKKPCNVLDNIMNGGGMDMLTETSSELGFSSTSEM
tara:strand:+ start:24 stop:221 length:198 start_codon:yes stop_codon:yes gene_type:complete